MGNRLRLLWVRLSWGLGTPVRKFLGRSPSRLEDRRARYLTGSTFILAEIGRRLLPGTGPVIDALVVVGLACFLAWFLSGMLKSRIEAQESAARVLALYDRWYFEVTLHHGHHSRWSEEVERKTNNAREDFRAAVREYTQALHEAGVGGWALQGSRDMLRAIQPIECSGWIDSLRVALGGHVLRHLL